MTQHPQKSARSKLVERLEPRTLLSSSFPNVNISRHAGNDSEGAIVADPTTPGRLFALSNVDKTDFGLDASRSTDDGQSWTSAVIADGVSDSLPKACCDPSLAWDSFGNLFMAYIDEPKHNLQIAFSTDGGQSFALLTTFSGDMDQPTIAAGASGVWVTVTKGDDTPVVASAAVNGPGDVGVFSPLAKLSGSRDGSFGDIAVSPNGQVVVTYQKPRSNGHSVIGMNIDPDGLGPLPFGKRLTAAVTNVGQFDYPPSQSERGIDAEAGFAFDNSSGPNRGRLYFIYTDSAPRKSNFDVFLRYSDNLGITWSNPARVNDDTGLADQILSRVVVDPIDGTVAMSWHDSRDDPGNLPGASADDLPNDDVAFYAAIARPTADGLALSANVRVSDGLTNTFDADNNIELGDYTGLAALNGVMHPVWADNSNSTGDNPDGTRKQLDLYTAAVDESTLTTTRLVLGGLGAGGNVAAILSQKGYTAVTKGSSFSFKVNYIGAAALNTTALNGAELLVTGPGVFSGNPQVQKIKRSKDGKSATVSYIIRNPAGRWTAANDGIYEIATTDALANLAPAPVAGVFGYFVVDA